MRYYFGLQIGHVSEPIIDVDWIKCDRDGAEDSRIMHASLKMIDGTTSSYNAGPSRIINIVTVV